MANPNVLGAPSIKFHSVDRILGVKELTPSTDPNSEYQTENIVLLNPPNSGKVFKISKIMFSLQRVYENSNDKLNRGFYLDLITDITDPSIANVELETPEYVTEGNGVYLDFESINDFSESICRIFNTVGTGNYARTNLILETDLQDVPMITRTILPSYDASGDLFFNSFVDQGGYFYLHEGQAFACWAEGQTERSGEPPNHEFTEYNMGRARIHFLYEEIG